MRKNNSGDDNKKDNVIKFNENEDIEIVLEKDTKVYDTSIVFGNYKLLFLEDDLKDAPDYIKQIIEQNKLTPKEVIEWFNALFKAIYEGSEVNNESDDSSKNKCKIIPFKSNKKQ